MLFWYNDSMTTAKTIQQNRARADAARKLHEQRTKERADKAATIKAVFQSERDGLVIQHTLKVAKQFVSYHQKIAQDAQGARQTGYKLEDGTQEVENYFLGKDERVAHLDKASGIQELVDFIERQIKIEEPTPNADLIEKVAEQAE